MKVQKATEIYTAVRFDGTFESLRQIENELQTTHGIIIYQDQRGYLFGDCKRDISGRPIHITIMTEAGIEDIRWRDVILKDSNGGFHRVNSVDFDEKYWVLEENSEESSLS